MDSPQKKAGSTSTMAGETRHLLLPVSVTAAKKTLLAARPEAVRVAVSAWVLFIASLYLLFFAVEWAVHHYHAPCRQQCRRLTDAEEAVDNALKIGMLFCGVFQAASALLALRLPRRRCWVRRALDYLALALTIGGHCIYAAAARLVLVADPGDVFFRIAFAVVIVIFAAGDIIGFLALLLLGGEA